MDQGHQLENNGWLSNDFPRSNVREVVPHLEIATEFGF